MTTTFTSAQLSVLSEIESNCITVVRAVPGAGKTRVFVEALKREIARRENVHSRAGVAALSFTNVAHEEISRRVEHAIGAPHFVGTLDTFLFRFIVRPFGSLVGLSVSGARLLPSPLDEVHRGPEIQYSDDVRKRASIFQARCISGLEGAPAIHIERTVVDAKYNSRVLSAKQTHWRSTGRLTHADVHYLAACILRGPHGSTVRNWLAKRFAVLLVDEFQDTGYFLGRAILALLEGPGMKGVVVGDPDQAIFRFGGAPTTLFPDVDVIAGRSGLVLDESHRCSKTVARIASALARSGTVVQPRPDAPEGCSLLLVYEQPPDLERIFSSLGTRAMAPVATLARSNATVRKLAVGSATSRVPGGSRFGASANRAVECFTDGDPATAARIMHSILGDLVFGEANLDTDGLREHGVTWMAWRKACHKVLFEAMQVRDAETWNQWVVRVRDRVRQQAETLGHPIEKLATKVKKFGDEGDNVRSCSHAVTDGKHGTVMTVHAAKGREFATVIFYVPKPHKLNAPCPSVEWWSSAADSEEREIAFVACSRAIHTLVLLVHSKTYEEVKRTQPGFVALFDVEYL